MKKRIITLVAFVLPLTLLLSGFSNKLNTGFEPPATTGETQTLLEFLESNRNFVNTDAAPALVPAAEVKKNLKNPKYHIIDIRTESWFDYGHVKDASNVQPSDLLTYFENSIVPADFEKIVLICYSGQSAAYFTSLLRIAGYDNVYSMNWGMSSWRVDFAENAWLKNTKSDFDDKLETSVNEKGPKGDLPSINTGKSDAEAILRARLEELFATPYKESITKASDVFANPGDYFVVDYNSLDQYQIGHIPTAVQYQPNGSLTSDKDLLTLPSEKKIAVYGNTGQETAYVVAYLDVLGYEASNIGYGANSFMYKTLKDNNFNAFTKKEVNMYPVIE
jgi:rhodanese-related sulfurtransferase